MGEWGQTFEKICRLGLKNVLVNGDRSRVRFREQDVSSEKNRLLLLRQQFKSDIVSKNLNFHKNIHFPQPDREPLTKQEENRMVQRLYRQRRETKGKFEELVVKKESREKHSAAIKQARHLRKVFKSHDIFNDGTVKPEECRLIMENMMGFTPAQSRRYIVTFDFKGDGRVHYEEFIPFYMSMRHKHKEIIDAFSKIAKAPNGIRFQTVNEALTHIINQKEIETLFALFDINGDGLIDLEEVVLVMSGNIFGNDEESKHTSRTYLTPDLSSARMLHFLPSLSSH